ncbi:MAG: response regulator [Gammaproteobacteria bacterium]
MSELEKTHVLVVDDSATIRKVIAKHLGEDYFTIHASNGEEAWQLIQSNDSIALVFADMHMPVMNGMLLLKQIRSSDCEHISNLPVIMITGHEDSEAAKQASYTMGATDFISKPFSALDIISRAGSYTKLNQIITTLEQNVTYDTLTGLVNRRCLHELGDKAISGSHRHQFALSILALQIDNTDEVQSKYGKSIVEQIIVSVADNIRKSLRTEDVLAHFGSGQFVALLPMTNAFKSHILALRIQKTINNLAFEMGDDAIRIKLATGLNSTEGYNQHITFTELSLQTEKALQLSLQDRACKVVRHDELISKEQHTNEYSKSSSEGEEQESSRDNLTANTENFSNHMAAVMNGDFEKIPAQYIENMIKPLESFLDYAYDQVKIELEKQQKNT